MGPMGFKATRWACTSFGSTEVVGWFLQFQLLATRIRPRWAHADLARVELKGDPGRTWRSEVSKGFQDEKELYG